MTGISVWWMAGVFSVVLGAQAQEGITSSVEDETYVVSNGLLTLRYVASDRQMQVVRAGKTVVHSVALWEEALGQSTAATFVSKATPMGEMKGISIQSSPDSPTRQSFFLAPGVPFLLVKAELFNAGAEPLERKTLVPFDAALDLGGDTGSLKWLGCDGLDPVSQGKTSYVFLTLADPATRQGVVGGWITHERASGIVSGSAEEGTIRLSARSEYGRVSVASGGLLEGETFALGFFEDVLDGLDAFAALTAKINNIVLPKDIPSGYCTWYHAGALNEKGMGKLAEFCAEQRLNEYGLTTLQIDDGWQIFSRDYTTHKPDGPYRSGMKATVDTIRAAGFRPGLWLIPFGWDAKSPTFAEHQDYFVHREDGSIYSVTWAGDCLDMTHPGAQALLKDTVRRAAQEWGYSYLKIDGLWSGIAALLLYPSPEYRDDGLGDAVFHDRTKTNLDAFRQGLRLVREAAGPDTYLLGCCIPQNMRSMGGSIGLVDGMRIGADISAEWKSIVGCIPMAARLYFWNGKVWYNDPDCLMVREPLTLDEARAWGSVIALSGQMNMNSDWIPGLPPERLDIIRRTMPNTGHVARPLDLLENNEPRRWHLRAEVHGTRRDIVGLFQWEDTGPATVRLELEELGLPTSPEAHYVGFDFWENQFIPAFSKGRDFEMRPGSCRVLAIEKVLERPQLISTSRHAAQLLAEVSDLRWEPDRKCLSGLSQVIAGDAYELRIHAGVYGMSAATVSPEDLASGVTISPREEKPFLRVGIASPQSRGVAWEIRFSE
jgi:hypothetical protein